MSDPAKDETGQQSKLCYSINDDIDEVKDLIEDRIFILYLIQFLMQRAVKANQSPDRRYNE